MSAGKKGRKSKGHHYCVFAGKTKKQCFKHKADAQKSAKARRARGLKGRVVKRAKKR